MAKLGEKMWITEIHPAETRETRAAAREEKERLPA